MNKPAIIDVALSAKNHERRKRLLYYETEMTNNMRYMAQLFRQMRDDKLEPWLPDYESFEECVVKKWGLSLRRVQQMIQAETVRCILIEGAPELAPVVNQLKDSAIRELPDGKEEKIAVLKKAVLKIGNGKVTAPILKEIQGKQEKPCCPSCHRPLP